MKEELKFISGRFFDFDIPKDKQYLWRYFRTEGEQLFLKYFFCFGNYDNFMDHTGFFCQKRWLHILRKRLDIIISFYQDAKYDIMNSDDDELGAKILMEIESGKIRVSGNFNGKFYK